MYHDMSCLCRCRHCSDPSRRYHAVISVILRTITIRYCCCCCCCFCCCCCCCFSLSIANIQVQSDYSWCIHTYTHNVQTPAHQRKKYSTYNLQRLTQTDNNLNHHPPWWPTLPSLMSSAGRSLHRQRKPFQQRRQRKQRRGL